MAYNIATDMNSSDPSSQGQAQSGQFSGQYDPQTLASMLQALPKIQQAQRRAQTLRAVQQTFDQQGQQVAQAKPQNYVPTQDGGLYQTVAQYRPDYGQAGQGIVDALGSAYAQHQANQAQDQYSLQNNAGILPYIQAAGGQTPNQPYGMMLQNGGGQTPNQPYGMMLQGYGG